MHVPPQKCTSRKGLWIVGVRASRPPGRTPGRARCPRSQPAQVLHVTDIVPLSGVEKGGSYFPSWLEARKRGEQALISVVAEAYVQGIGTRKVEALVQSLGIAGHSKSEVSRIAASLDAQVKAFRTWRLDAEYPYVWIEACYEHVREDHRVQSMAVVGAYGMRRDGVREVLGLDIGLSEDVAVWRAFLQGLVARGVRGAKLVISDAHPGLDAENQTPLPQAVHHQEADATYGKLRVRD